MLSTFNLRFAHFPSRAPIMLELQVDPNTTVGQLRALVEEKLATEDHCLVRVFARWYLEARAGEVRRFSELTDADGGSVLSAVGIEDECELYLEGPVIEAEQNSIGKALAIVSMQGRQAQIDLSQKLDKLGRQTQAVLLSEVSTLKVVQQAQVEAKEAHAQQAVLLDEVSALRESVSNLNQKLAELTHISLAQQKQIEALTSRQERQHQMLSTKQSEGVCLVPTASHSLDPLKLDRANSLLIKHSGMPLKALWEVMNDKESSVELAMAIVLDRRCGLERRSIVADGEMRSKGGLVLNNERGGLTPLIMAALAGRVDVMKAFLAAGADVNAKEEGDNGNTVIHVAAITNVPSAIELLVSYGSDVNACRSGGYTPLNDAAYNCNLEALEMLLVKGADITKVDNDGNTPLKLFEAREKDLTWKSQEMKDCVRQLLTTPN